jgi:hypothetical protein
VKISAKGLPCGVKELSDCEFALKKGNASNPNIRCNRGNDFILAFIILLNDNLSMRIYRKAVACNGPTIKIKLCYQI